LDLHRAEMVLRCVALCAATGSELAAAEHTLGWTRPLRYAALDVEPEYSFVIPVFNERETLEELQRRLLGVLDRLDGPAEVLLIDDGSRDGSFEILLSLHERDPRFKVIRLSRNFGHQVAITVGLDHAQGRGVVVMDADLQDPPEVALELAKRWREGYEVVYAVRDERHGETRAKLMTAKWFYRLLDRLAELDIPGEVGEFRLVDRRALQAMNSMREHRRYLRGMYAWVGFNQAGVHYVRDGRHAGATKYPLRKMVAFALDGIVSFSTAPLRLTLNLGFLVSVLAFVAGFATIVLKVAGVYAVPGWASVVVFLAFVSGVQLTVLGVMGQYIAHIHEEVKRRPLYLVSDAVGVEPEVGPFPAAPATRESVRANL
jgi:glycosyltransferase involved in cell wall biosynthesis